MKSKSLKSINGTALSATVILLFCCWGYIGYSQDPIPEAMFELSAQSKMISEQLEKPTINNTGSIDLQIPLYSLSVGNFQIPILLNYNTGGIKVTQRPSVVGLGWNLSCGGVVQRMVRGNVDEYVHLNDFLNPLGTRDNYKANYDVSYIGNCDKLNRTDWNTATFKDETYTSPGYSFTSNNNNTGFKTITIDLAPDEFQFNVNGLSGSFYLDHMGKWQVKSNKSVTVDVILENNVIVPPPPPSPYGFSYNIPRAITTITLTDEQGNKYIFGKTTDNNSIEFSRGVTDSPPPGYFENRNYTNEIAVVAWYLSKVVTPGGDEIVYKYQGVYQLNTRGNPNMWYLLNGVGGNGGGYAGSTKYISKSLVRTPVLEKITTSRGISVEFSTGNSIQFDNDIYLDETKNSGEHGFSIERLYLSKALRWYRDIDQFDVKATLVQLNEIKVKYLDNVREKITFSYTNSPTERLKLLSLNFYGNAGLQPHTYSFGYNPTLLPGYNSGNEDLLGYNNGVNYFGPHPYNAQFSYTQLVNEYLPSRQPHPTLVSAESLTKITNPTGGSIEYEYESNSYRSYVERGGYNLVTPGNAQPGGGQRVKKITVKANDGSAPRVSNYFYIKDYQDNPNSGISSGVLYDDLLAPLVTGVTDKWRCEHMIMSERKGNESPLTYTEITSVEENNGYTIRKFSGYSNGQLDAPPFHATLTNVYPFNSPSMRAYIKKDLNRGKLLEEVFYNNSRKPVRKMNYEYFHQHADVNELDYVRSVLYLKKEINSTQTIFSFVAFPQYYYNNYLYSADFTDYDYSGGVTKTLTQSEKYFYENTTYKKLLTKSEKKDSRGNTFITETRYPVEYANVAPVFDTMIARNMIGLPVDQIRSVKNNTAVTKELSRNHANYSLWGSNLLVKPASIQSSFRGEALLPGNMNQVDITYASYDAKGNILQQSSKRGKLSYEWGYDGLYPVVKIMNADNSGIKEFFYEGFESLTGSTTIAPFAGQKYLTGDYQVPFIKPNAKNYFIDYRYFDGNSWKYNKRVFTNNIVLSDGQAIDEVRVYPENAQMTTYTYDPYIGVTSEIDKEGRAIFNEYDQFGRVVVIRDEYRNIVKSICYNYLGQLENCLKAYGNESMGQFFIRDNCGPGYAGAEMGYDIGEGVYFSFLSKDDANRQAVKDINDNGQNYVNTHAACMPVVYAKLGFDNVTYHTVEDIGERKYEEVRADMYISFFTDAACIQEASVTNLDLSVQMDPDAFLYGGAGQPVVQATCDGHSTLVLEGVAIRRVDSFLNTSGNWEVLTIEQLQHNLQASRFIIVVP